jgi:hypothetical protein
MRSRKSSAHLGRVRNSLVPLDKSEGVVKAESSSAAASAACFARDVGHQDSGNLTLTHFSMESRSTNGVPRMTAIRLDERPAAEKPSASSLPR